jgi:hypothetical protein
MSYASTDDVAAALGRPSSSEAETAQWQWWLDVVERSIERAFRRGELDFEDQLDLNDPSIPDVIDVEVAAVVRKIQNPTWGVTSITRAVDDASVTTRNERGDTGDPLFLTDDEWNTLLPGSQSGAFSTRPGFETSRETEDAPFVWVSIQP